jgi:hypothetical protein
MRATLKRSLIESQFLRVFSQNGLQVHQDTSGCFILDEQRLLHALVEMLGGLTLLKFYEDDRLAMFDQCRDIQEQNHLARGRPRDAESSFPSPLIERTPRPPIGQIYSIRLSHSTRS